jgi:hypothetical protein
MKKILQFFGHIKSIASRNLEDLPRPTAQNIQTEQRPTG